MEVLNDGSDSHRTYVSYQAFSVKDFLDNKDSVDVAIGQKLVSPLFDYYTYMRAQIFLSDVGVYKLPDQRYRVEDMTGDFECSHTPFWFPPGFRTSRNIHEGRQNLVMISYRPDDQSAFLMSVFKFGPKEGESDLEGAIHGALAMPAES